MINKITLIMAFVLLTGLVYVFKDWQYQKRENKRITENAEAERKADSIGFSQIILTKEEANQELQYNNRRVMALMDSLRIDVKQLKRVVSTRTFYSDTVKRTTVLETIVKAIEQKQPVKERFTDSTECHIIKGYLHFDGEDVEISITDRQFSSATDIVVYVEKVGLRFWKWFRRRKATVSVLNSCGETTTKIIDLQRK